MVRFTFVSGKENSFDYDWDKLTPKLQLAGMRLFKPDKDLIIPLNSNTIALIENFPEIVDDGVVEVPETETVQLSKEDIISAKEEETVLSIEEKKEKILSEMKELSECPHEVREYYYQEVMTGPRGAQKPQKRYFPVCVKCGVRERYVKNESLTDEEKLNAKPWDK